MQQNYFIKHEETCICYMREELAKTYSPNDFESDLYKWWLNNGYFKPETQEKLGIASEETFCNTLPPPNVTGVLHLGHAMTISLQDLMVRHARMQYKKTVFVPGTDHAGIATQNVVERELSKQGINRKELGREKFIEKVWEWKHKSHAIISTQSQKMGMSCDWDREAFTMDENLSKAVRKAFVTLYEKDLIYRGNYLINWCPGRCESAVSDLEAEPKEEIGNLWYIRYPVITDNWNGPQDEWGSGNWAKGAEQFIEVATTRPETLLGDSAVATNSEHPLFGKLIGKTAVLPVLGRRIPIIDDEAVDPEFGTGAVKITPAHDFNDYETGKRHNLAFYTIFDKKAVVLKEFGGPYTGMDRFVARDAIIEDLKKEGLLTKIEEHEHVVPHCQRCATIVEPMDSVQWFVRTKPLVKQVLAKIESDGINFIPSNMIDRLYHWLNPNTIRDWCISRQLWWGHQIPIWYCQKCGKTTSGLDDPTVCSHCGSSDLQQDPDVLDTWFSSGLWPFSTLGWPESTKDLENFYPNELRETGYDILFFWVARELMMGVELTGKLPYKNVYFHGLVRNEVGKKISKSMENIEEYDPLNIIKKYGADTLRYTLIAYSTPGLDMNLDPKNLDASHKFGNKIWQATKFALGNIPDDFAYVQPTMNSDLLPVDQWMLAETHRVIRNVSEYYDVYNFLEAARELKRFFWSVFADWYIEISKIRIYNESTDYDPRHLLVYVLDVFMRLFHPIMPFITEKLWQQLPAAIKDQNALIITKWPEYVVEYIDEKVIEDYQNVMNVISAIRQIRGEFDVAPSKKITAMIEAKGKVRQLKKSVREIKRLGGLDSVSITAQVSTNAKVISTVVDTITIYIPIRGLVEVEMELKRLDKEIAKLSKLVAGSERKLQSDFVKRAPKDLVEKERAKVIELQQKITKLEERKTLIE